MDERLAFTHSRSDWGVRRGGIAFSERGIGRWNPASGDGTGSLAVDDGHEAESRSAQPHRLVEHRIEDRREVTRRGVDNLQYLGGCGLLLQCLARLAQKPRILDRDDRLIGEGSDQFDLPLAKWINPLTREPENPDRLPLAQ